MKLPEPGTPVQIRTRNPQWANRGAYMFEVQEFIDYTGTVYPQQKWQATEPVINITTTIPWMPFRVIPLSWIEDLQVGGASVQIDLPKATETRVWTVEGSRGNTYTVTQQGSKMSCTCPGFQFRRHCRHIAEKETA